jgi:subtilase family serine protease
MFAGTPIGVDRYPLFLEETVPEPFFRRARARRILSVTAGATLAAALAFSSGATAMAADHATYPGSKPTWARPANDVGVAPDDGTVEGEIGFDLKDQAGAEAYAKAVSTPGSPTYGRYLSPAAWIDRFAPATSDFTPMLQYLKDNGLIITGVPKSRLFITFRGTTTQLDALFGAALHVYRYQGHSLVAPSKAPTLKAGLATGVSAIALDQGRLLTRPDAAKAATASAPTATTPASGIAPCSMYWGQHTATLPPAYGRTVFNTANCGYTGKQFRSAYGVPASLTGAGQTVAIIDAYASPSIVRDVNTLAAKHGQAPLTGATYTQKVPGTFYDGALCGYPSGWQGEQTLDVDAVHNVAPKAKVLYVGGFNCGTGLDVAMSQILDDKLATIVSNSYGYVGEYAQDLVQVNENQHVQAIGEGIGLYFSSGDSGDESLNLGTTSPDYPASSPYVTAVGGTTTEVAKNGSVALETGWGNDYDSVLKDTTTGSLSYKEPVPGAFASGAGGGVSSVFARPWYQQGVVSSTGRAVPDVAADADPRTGELIGIRPIVDESTLAVGPYTEEIYGGTSLASPLFAAEAALVQQATHSTIGFANPLFYDVFKAKPASFRDVLPRFIAVAYDDQFTGLTSLVTGNRDTSLTTAPGWDDVTGLGALSISQLRNVWSRH